MMETMMMQVGGLWMALSFASVTARMERSAVAPPPTTPSASIFDPKTLDFQIRGTFHDGYPLFMEAPRESQPIKTTDKAGQDKTDYFGNLGLSSLREETEFYDRLSGKIAPTPDPVPIENPLWQQQYEPMGHPRFTALKQQLESAGNVFEKYQHFLRGTAPQQTSPEVYASPKKDESINVDTLLAVAAVSKPETLLGKKAQVLANSFEYTPQDPLQRENALLENVPDSGKLEAAEAQRWREMVHLSHLERDRVRYEPFDPMSRLHAETPPVLEEASSAPPSNSNLWVPPSEMISHDDATPSVPDAPVASPSRSARSHLWDPPSQATDEILGRHGQSDLSRRSPIVDLWAPPSSKSASFLEKRDVFVPTSPKEWDDVLKRYQSAVQFPYRG